MSAAEWLRRAPPDGAAPEPPERPPPVGRADGVEVEYVVGAALWLGLLAFHRTVFGVAPVPVAG